MYCRNAGFDVRGNVKLFDFGLAKELQPRDRIGPGEYNASGRTGTRRYMSPEVALCLPYGKPADVYSFAILFWEVLALEQVSTSIFTRLLQLQHIQMYQSTFSELKPHFLLLLTAFQKVWSRETCKGRCSKWQAAQDFQKVANIYQNNDKPIMDRRALKTSKLQQDLFHYQRGDWDNRPAT